jgi:RING/Ubox like zinc-binding domain/RNA recognition motif. (a.k.a. RRM, RBD, or RNP domain)
MWCWHRIRETESGLCPACRTPYGEDPHMFSAVDVEDVLKANKEKEAAAKRERQRQYDQQQQQQLGGGQSQQQQQDSAPLGSTFAAAAAAAVSMSASSHYHQLSNTEACIEAPKDRSTLANMRVIRRNLVYCVGLPPNIATEENLRKPEYFGQYGKIAKIVINRSQVNATPGTDPRRASASAYVTFVHKEDTLACILAMDGFYMDNRNIRASYGTSKYCSAFIKSVRCNNPECTYLHEMGSPDDTFTKQEIQAGYATSGSCVIRSVARAMPRKKVGGGGPSGTGKVAQNPVFPAPEFEEAPKPPAVLVPPPLPSAQSIQRATTVAGAGAAAAAAVGSSATALGAKAGRSASVGNRSPTLSSTTAAVPPAAVSVAASPATVAGASVTGRNSTAAPVSGVPPLISAASVVAGVHSVTAKAVEVAGGAHTTLTPLTPLKRQKAPKPVPASAPPQPLPPPSDAAEKLRSSSNINSNKKKTGTSTSLTPSPTLTAMTTNGNGIAGPSSIGGDVIGPPLPRRTSGGIAPGSMAGLGGEPFGGPDLTAIGALGVQQDTGGGSGTFLGGEVFTGMLPNNNINSSTTAIGSGKDKWNASPTFLGGRDFGSDNGNNSNGGSGVSTLWDNRAASHDQNFNHGGPDTPIGGGHDSGIIGSFMTGGSGATPSASNSSSALASIHGINLPTGSGSLSGSLQESNLWSSSAAPVPMSAPAMPSPLSALNEFAMPVQGEGFMGGSTNYSGGSSLIGGVPIGGGSGGGGSLNPAGPIGGAGGGGGRRSDIALLQSLLPGVYITSGAENLGFNGAGSVQSAFGAGSPAMAQSTMTMGLGPSGLNGDAIGNNWNGGGGVIPTAAAGSSMGAIGRNNAVQQDRRGHGIW